ncbi:MAG: winged helix-turn-helix domain-containing protein [Candidatus Heimdallarchaeota archaeon]
MTLNGSYVPQWVERKWVRRSRFEIWAEILESCARTTRTRNWLLCRVGLKPSAIKEALNFLMTAGLIEQLPSSNRDLGEFQTTAKGEDALTQFYQLVTKYFVQE